MTTVKQLYSLQEVDLALDAVERQLAEAQHELSSQLGLDQIEEAISVESSRLEGVRSQQRAQQMEADSLRERLGHLEQQLYGGGVANPRDLASLEQEAAHARQQAENKELEILELSEQATELQEKVTALQEKLAETQSAWEVRKVELREQIEEAQARRDSLAAQKKTLAEAVNAAELQKYESLRRSKGGLAVAKVERGLCQACRMSLPSQHLQRARTGKQTVLCSSCGRMLFPG